MPGLADIPTEDERTLRAVIRGRQAWIAVAKLADEPGSVDRLIGLDLLAAWGLPEPEGPAVTLTPWSAFLLGVEIRERIVRDGDGYQEVPYWCPIERPESPLMLPRHAHECRLKLPELVVDPIPSPLEVLMDEEGEPVLLFGEQIRVDRRIKGKAKGKAAKAKRKAMRRAG